MFTNRMVMKEICVGVHPGSSVPASSESVTHSLNYGAAILVKIGPMKEANSLIWSRARIPSVILNY